MKRAIIFSCEHAGNEIPEGWKHLFHQGKEALNSHRGYDPGAKELFNLFYTHIPSQHLSSQTSRLLVELNRSPHHPNLFSEFTKPCSKIEKEEILTRYYFPYRNQLTEMIRTHTSSGRHVLHISVHSYTPELNGIIRQADIGLLYDPSRSHEKNFCAKWKQVLESEDPSIRVRRNYPYLGKADGLTTFLRRIFSGNQYIGIELEVNQKLLIQYKSNSYIGEYLVRTLQSLIS